MSTATAQGPVGIVNLILRWDTAGVRFGPAYTEALGRVYCYMPENDCMSEELAWGMANVVTSYEVRPVSERSDSAVVEVVFSQVGVVDPSGFTENVASARDTVWFRRIDGRWRIVNVESQIQPHLSRAAAYREWSVAVPDSVVLKAQLGSM